MHNIFRFPADTPPMTFGNLAGRLDCGKAGCTICTARIGTTVTLRWHTRDQSAVAVQLYDTTIAVLASDGTIRFPNDDAHKATGSWIERIVRDNGLGLAVFRIRRRASDGPGNESAVYDSRSGKWSGPGLLVIDGDRAKPAIGRIYRENPAHAVVTS
jgi:hypothetical protein